MGRAPEDRDGPRSLEQALRRLIAAEGKSNEAEASELAEEFFGRPDALELLEEVVVEARLRRVLAACKRIAPYRERERGAAVRPRALEIASLHTRESARRGVKTWRSWAVAAVALLAFGVASSAVAIHLLRGDAGEHGAPQYLAASTGAAELDTLDLPDGSRVILAPNTTVSYAIDARRGPRDVKLEGEAYFEVLHNEARQFRVETRGAIVTDLGTRFVVREYPTDGRAQVVVRSGAASVESRNSGPTSPIRMARGDGAYIDAHGEISRFSGDPESYAAWTNGKLAFDGAALPEVLDRLGRWYDVEFRLADSTLSTQYFTGEFRSAPLAEALAILGPIVHARFAQEGREVVVTAIPAGR